LETVMQMSDQQDPRADSVRLSKGWAMATFIGLMTVALMLAFFFAQTTLYGRLSDAQAATSRQQHCLAVREACHDRELVPELCSLRERRNLDPRTFGPNEVPCPGAPPRQEGLCNLVTTVPTVSCSPPEAPAPASGG
jgi:hypothetical protein